MMLSENVVSASNGPTSNDPASNELGIRALSHLDFNAQEVQSCFDRRPFSITHRLTQHPLLQLPRIIELSTQLPAASVEYNAGDLSVNQDPTLTPRNGLSIEQTLQQIENCRSWMVLKNIEQDIHYKQLLDECLNELQPAIEAVVPGMTARKAFIFVSSPGAITPYHVDFEYNFLLQIRGRKFMTVFDAHDRSVLSEAEREMAVSGAPRNLQYRDEYAIKSQTFDMQPGSGVHVPLTSPHWVKVGDAVSVSFSITFHSLASDRTISVHKTNSFLRKIGIEPQQVGRSAMSDSLKYAAHRVYRKAEAVKHRLSQLRASHQ